MYALHPLSFRRIQESTTGNPVNNSARGTSVTPGASNSDSTPVPLGSALAFEACRFIVCIDAASTTSVSATDTSVLIDILMDPAGGTTWDTTNILIEGLISGAQSVSAACASARRIYDFPLLVPKGATIAARGRNAHSAPVAQLIRWTAYGGLNRPEQWWCGQRVDPIGLDRANSKGTSITPGASANTWPGFASFGSATARRYGALIPGISINSTTVNNVNRQLRLGIGGDDIGPIFEYNESVSEISGDIQDPRTLYVDVPLGTQLQAQIRTSGASGSNDQLALYGVS